MSASMCALTYQRKQLGKWVKVMFIHLLESLKKIFLLFLAALDLHRCVWTLFSFGEQELLFLVLHRLLIMIASLVAEHRFQAHGLQEFSTWAQQLWVQVVRQTGFSGCVEQALVAHVIWNHTRPGTGPMSPAMAGLSTVPPGMSLLWLLLTS